MSIAEKLQTIAQNEQRVYDKGFEDGKSSATMSGTISFTNATKILTITGLSSVPKEFNLYAAKTTIPTDDTQCFIRGMDYDEEGYGTPKKIAALYLIVNQSISATMAAIGAITEKQNSNNNIFTFVDGVFTIDLSYHDKYIFGENFTYNWTAVL